MYDPHSSNNLEAKNKTFQATELLEIYKPG